MLKSIRHLPLPCPALHPAPHAAGYLTRWVFSGPQAVLHALLVSCVLLRLHPRPLAHTPSYEFTVSFMGVSLESLCFGEGCLTVSNGHRRRQIVSSGHRRRQIAPHNGTAPQHWGGGGNQLAC